MTGSLKSPAWLVAALIMLAAVACASEVEPGSPTTTTAVGSPAVSSSPVSSSPPATAVPETSIAASTSTATPAPSPTATPTASPTPGVTPTPSPLPFPPLEFVDNPDCKDVKREPLPLADVTITDGETTVRLVAEMAVSSADQSQGLMCRAAVPDGTGMLFIWDTDYSGGFWMFNTYVPLDILYFGAEIGVAALREMSPCPRQEGEDSSAWSTRCAGESDGYRPGIYYMTALELPQGWLESQGFDTSDVSEIVVSWSERN